MNKMVIEIVATTLISTTVSPLTVTNYNNQTIEAYDKPIFINATNDDKNYDKKILEDKNRNRITLSYSYEINNKRSEETIISELITNELGRKSKITVKIDADIDVAYFVIETNDDSFESDYRKLETLDDITRDLTLYGNRVVVTLEDSNV